MNDSVQQNSFTRHDEWSLAIQIQAVIRESAVALLWIANNNGDEVIRQREIKHALEQLDATIPLYQQAKKKKHISKQEKRTKMKRRVTRKELIRLLKKMFYDNENDASSITFKTGYECALEDIAHHFGEVMQREKKK